MFKMNQIAQGAESKLYKDGNKVIKHRFRKKYRIKEMKALVLFSGGLDSRLALKLMQDQDIEVEAIHFKLPFEGCCLPTCAFKFTQLEEIKIHIVVLEYVV